VTAPGKESSALMPLAKVWALLKNNVEVVTSHRKERTG
jgi:hypothetical protein